MILAMMLMLMQADDPRDAWHAPPFRNQVGDFAIIFFQRAFDNATTEITLGMSGSVLSGHYLIRRRLIPVEEGQIEHAYTNSRDCPAALEHIRELPHLVMPAPHVPPLDGEEQLVVVTDGARYVLEGRGSFPFRRSDASPHDRTHADYRIESNVGTPLARWVDSMLAALQPCWSATARH